MPSTKKSTRSKKAVVAQPEFVYVWDTNGQLFQAPAPEDDFFEHASTYKATRTTKKSQRAAPYAADKPKKAISKKRQTKAAVEAPVTKKAKKQAAPKVSVEDHAAEEALSKEEMDALYEKELDKKYAECQKFSKWYRKNILKPRKRAALSPLERVLEDMRAVCNLKSRYLGLERVDFDANPKNKPLKKALPKLFERGCKDYTTVLSDLSQLDVESQEAFWAQNPNNREITSFTELWVPAPKSLSKKDLQKIAEEAGVEPVVEEVAQTEETQAVEVEPVAEEQHEEVQAVEPVAEEQQTEVMEQ